MKRNIKKGRYLYYDSEVYDLGGGDDGQAMAKAEEALTAAQAAQTTADGAATAAGNAQTTADGKAPIYHASENNTYGVGDYLHYGHVKLADTPNASMQAGDGYAATPAAVQSAIDQGKWDLLWTNASPNSNFAAQTISLDLSKYQFVYVVVKRAADVNECFGVVMEKGYTFRVTYSIATSNTINRVYIRFRTYAVSNTGVTCGTGTQLINSGTNDGYCTPLKIWGIKG